MPSTLNYKLCYHQHPFRLIIMNSTTTKPMQSLNTRIAVSLEYGAILSLCCAVFCFPYHHNPVKIAMPIVALCTVCAGLVHQHKTRLFQHKTLWASLGLLTLFAVGMTYGETTWRQALAGFCKYSKLAYYLVLIPLLQNPMARRASVWAFIAGILSFALLHIGMLTLNYMPSHPGEMMQSYRTLINPIPLCALEAFATGLLAYYGLHATTRWPRHIALGLALFFAWHLTYYIGERTGLLILFAMGSALAYQRLGLRGILLILVGSLVALYIANQTSTLVHQKLLATQADILQYRHTYQTSLGYRIHFIEVTFQALRDHLLLGRGTGSFVPYLSAHVPSLRGWREPHMAYLMIAFQLGLLGLLTFFTWLACLLRDAAQQGVASLQRMQLLVAGLLALGLCIPMLHQIVTGYSIIWLTTLILTE